MQHLSSSRRRAQLNKEYRRLFIRSRKGGFSFSCTSGSTLRQKNRWVRVGTMCRCLRNSREGTFSERSTVPQLHVQFCSSKFLFSFCRVVEWSFHLNEAKEKKVGSDLELTPLFHPTMIIYATQIACHWWDGDTAPPVVLIKHFTKPPPHPTLMQVVLTPPSGRLSKPAKCVKCPSRFMAQNIQSWNKLIFFFGWFYLIETVLMKTIIKITLHITGRNREHCG